MKYDFGYTGGQPSVIVTLDDSACVTALIALHGTVQTRLSITYMHKAVKPWLEILA